MSFEMCENFGTKQNKNATLEISNKLSSKFGEQNYIFSNNNHVLTVKKDNLLNSLKYLKVDLGFIMLLDICGVDNAGRYSTSRFESIYHLLNMELHQRVRIKVFLEAGEEIPSITKLWKGADWFERESWDMFGINYSPANPLRLLNHPQFIGHPLQKDYVDDETACSIDEITPCFFSPTENLTKKNRNSRQWIDIRPGHPLSQGNLRIMLELEGESIKRTNLEIGYLHRNYEKICEGKQFNQIIAYSERLNYHSPPLNSIGWCKAVEELAQIKIPEKAKALRMVYSELARIMDHLLCIGSMARDLGGENDFHFCFKLRSSIQQLLKKISGHNIFYELVKIGGMTCDLPPAWITECIETLKYIESNLTIIDEKLTKNPIFVDRLKVGEISALDAVNWGYSGPCLRSCGVNYDIRKASPYYFYGQLDFEIPLGINGDCFDRYLIRLEEIRQSEKIISQLLDNLPAGNIINDDLTYSLPVKEKIIDPIKRKEHFDLITEGIKPATGEIYSSTEAANGELGFFVISDGGSKPYRVKVRPPCFPILQSFPEIVHNNHFSDMAVILSSLNIVAGELDR